MKNPHFRLNDGTLYLFDGDEMITAYRRLAFVVDVSEPDCCILMKYGEEERLLDWQRNAAPAMRGFARLITVCQDNWQIEEINKFINNTGYIGNWIKRNIPELLTAA